MSIAIYVCIYFFLLKSKTPLWFKIKIARINSISAFLPISAFQLQRLLFVEPFHL